MFKAPEGMEWDPEGLKEAHAKFKELNLSQEQAQGLMDLYGQKIKEAEDSPYKLWMETQEKWRDEIKADPEIGGKLDQVKTTVARAIDGLGDPKLAADFRQAMDFTGAGNNPAFIRTFYKLALMVTEGRPATAGRPSPAAAPSGGKPSSLAAAMYPHLPTG